jgi:hypothetical protein|tara:strand:+ start:1540 stop:1743 length:204 start_codon:yes stop_codon:yes gene_type:complete
LKLALFEVDGDHPEAAAPGEFHHRNHLCVETETWMQSPDGARWRWYVKSGDTDQIEHANGTSGVCCG